MNGFHWTCLLEVLQSLPELNFPKLITLYNRQYTSYIEFVTSPDKQTIAKNEFVEMESLDII